MANSPIVFSPEEQLQLQQLENQGNAFTAYKNLVTRSLYSGQDASLAANLLNFLSDLVAQSTNQVNAVRSQAQARANQSSEEAAPLVEAK